MDKYVDLFKRHVLHFKLELCCFMASVRSGLLAFTCLNMAIGVMTLMFFSEGSMEPLLLKVLNGINESPPNYGPSCVIVYAIELGSNVVILCGMLRNDLVLLRVYLYYALGVLTAALMVYCLMFKFQTSTVECLIVASIGYQIYIILLVRSAMIEIKQASKRNGYSVNYRRTSVRYSRPGSRDRYSVVIEPYRPRGSLVPVVVKDRNTPTIVKEVVKEEVKEATVTVQTKNSDTKEVGTKKEDAKDGDFKKVVVKEETSKEGVIKGETAKETTAKDATEDSIKEVKEQETKKRKRSFFGRKEKKKDESQPINESSK